MSMIRIDKTRLVRAIFANTDASEQDARAIINTVLAAQDKEHGKNCQEDLSARDVCEGMYIDKVDECLRLVSVIRSIYALVGEDEEIKNLVDGALLEYD